MIDHLFDRYHRAVQRVVLVVHPSFAAGRQTARRNDRAISRRALCEQPTPTGMLDAILLASDAAQRRPEARMDYMVRSDRRASRHDRDTRRLSRERADAPAILPTCRQATPYIHLDRDAKGASQPSGSAAKGTRCLPVGESDMGLFSLSPDAYFNLLPRFGARSRAGGRHAREKFSAVPPVARPARPRGADVSLDERARSDRRQHAGRSAPARGVPADLERR